MLRPVLLGGRRSFAAATQTVWLVLTWLPVGVMLAVIVRESTSMFSSENTSGWMRVVYEALLGHVADWRWPAILHTIRKTGHFLGYGTLGLTWLRAWMLMWLSWLQRRSAWVWRGYCVAMALACTALVASLDELHQSYLPDRTGVCRKTCCSIVQVRWRSWHSAQHSGYAGRGSGQLSRLGVPAPIARGGGCRRA